MSSSLQNPTKKKVTFNIFPEHVVAFTTQRDNDFALSLNDAKGMTAQQMSAIAQVAHMSLSDIVSVKQVHGDKIVFVDDQYMKNFKSIEEADALITSLVNVPIAVRTADCLPAFIYDPRHNACGVVHAGWKGTAQKITQKTALMMMDKFKSNPSELLVAFGPAIQKCCYEVGVEMEDVFPKAIESNNHRRCLNMPLANRQQLLDIGVLDKNIEDCGLCSHCGKDWFSFRREKEAAGRMLSLMMVKSI